MHVQQKRSIVHTPMNSARWTPLPRSPASWLDGPWALARWSDAVASAAGAVALGPSPTRPVRVVKALRAGQGCAARVLFPANLTKFAKRTDGSIRNLKRDVPRKKVGLGGVLESATCRQQQMVVFIEIVDRPDIESGAVLAVDCVGGLMEQFSAYDQFVGHLPLQEPAKEPKILVIRATAVVDPVSTTAVRRPVAQGCSTLYSESVK